MIIGAVDKMFVRYLQTKYVEYLNISTRDIINHLYSEYARISVADLQNNDVVLKTAYDPNQPIESLFDQVENALDYAAARNTPYSPAQVVATAFWILFATGMFLDDCKTWKRKTDSDKTWDSFKTYFSWAHREFRETCTTTAGSGFSATNSAESLSSYHPNAAYQQDMVKAIANLSSATTHDCESVATLTATVSTLTTDLATTNAKLIKALVETTKLTATVGKLRRTTAKPRRSGQHYCWSCGYVSSHSIWECPNPKDGQDKYAKSADTKGGSTRNKPS